MSNVTRIYGFLQADLWSFSLFSLTNEEMINYLSNKCHQVDLRSFFLWWSQQMNVVTRTYHKTWIIKKYIFCDIRRIKYDVNIIYIIFFEILHPPPKGVKVEIYEHKLLNLSFRPHVRHMMCLKYEPCLKSTLLSTHYAAEKSYWAVHLPDMM